VQKHLTRSSSLEEFHGVKPFVVRGRRITENPVGLDEHVAHFFMSQSDATEDPPHE
jgi:hypothetical protein